MLTGYSFKNFITKTSILSDHENTDWSWIKALGIPTDDSWIRSDFFFEDRWQERHPICTISLANLYSELKARVSTFLQGNNKEGITPTHRNTHCLSCYDWNDQNLEHTALLEMILWLGSKCRLKKRSNSMGFSFNWNDHVIKDLKLVS